MATGKASDFKIYNDQLYGGIWEGLSQWSQGFNEASGNAIQLVPRDRRGDYAYNSFFKSISNVVSRRDTTSVAAVTDLAMTQDESISVKINRKFGPIGHTIDAWKKVGEDPETMSFVLGQMMAEEMRLDMINTAILAVEAAIESQATLVYDATGLSTKTMTHTHMIRGMQKMGDFASLLRLWVMYNKPYFDLLAQAVADNIFQVGGAVILNGSPPTFNKRVLQLDAPALWDANGSLDDTYNTLCLTEGAVICEESENPPEIFFGKISGQENLIYRFQAEWAFNLTVKGFKWNVSGGAANPTNSALGTTSNWTKAVTSVKQCAGVRIVTQ